MMTIGVKFANTVYILGLIMYLFQMTYLSQMT